MKSIAVVSLCLCLCLCGVHSDDAIDLPPEMRLYKHLIENYDAVNPDRAVIPQFTTEETQLVEFGVGLVSFLSYDPAYDFATFSLRERYSWKDQLLTWTPEEFGDIKQIRIPIQKIWRPDMVLYNGVGPEPEHRDTLAVVMYDGEVLYVPKTERTVQCYQGDDILQCWLKYGSWTYDSERMDLGFFAQLEEVDLSDYIHHKDYDVVEYGGTRNTMYYPCCVEMYPNLTFSLKFKKRAAWWHIFSK